MADDAPTSAGGQGYGGQPSPTPGGGWVPVPDPTKLTTDAVDRGVASLRELLETRLNAMDGATRLRLEQASQAADDTRAEIGHLKELLESRLTAMDRATLLLADDVGKVPSVVDVQLRQLREFVLAQVSALSDRTEEKSRGQDALMQEKFDAVNTRFLERDTRTEQAAQESRISLDAALAAAKEAVSEQNKANATAIQKSEIATKEQINANQANTQTTIQSLAGRLDDLKERVDRGEGQTTGHSDSRTEQRLNISQVIAALAVLAAVVSIILYATKK